MPDKNQKPSRLASVALRAIARDEARRSEEPPQWTGAGDYTYKITDEGIEVTGGEASKTLAGGRSVILPWDDRSPKNIDMLDAIVREWRSLPEEAEERPKPADAGDMAMFRTDGGIVSYRATPPEPAPDVDDGEPASQQVSTAPIGPSGEYYGEDVPLSEAFDSKPRGHSASYAARSRDDEGVRLVPPKGASDVQYWTPPLTQSERRIAAAQAAMRGIEGGEEMEYEGRSFVPVYDTKTGKMRYMSSGDVLPKDLD